MGIASKLATLAKVLYAWKIRGEEEAQYKLLDGIATVIYPRFKLPGFGRLYLYDDEFIRQYEKVASRTDYHSLDRKFMLDQLLKLIANVPGSTAECGVFEGASSYFMCRRVAEQGRPHRVFDSFEGLSTVLPVDGTYWKPGVLAATEDTVRETLAEYDFVTYHRGWIPACFTGHEDESFAFVHIDVDLYQPTLDSFKFFYPRMSSGGILLCDDSGTILTCPGARKAVDEFFSDKGEPVIEIPTGQTLIIKGSDRGASVRM